MTAVKLTEDARADLVALPSQALQRIALQWMSRLRKNPRLGQLLGWREGQDLRACRKIYLDENDRRPDPRRRTQTRRGIAERLDAGAE